MNEELIRERVRIDGARGKLVGELAYPGGKVRCACLLLNPHPYMGGLMENPVIARLAGDLAEAGLVTLRFDYTGAGASDGMRIDVAAAMAEFWKTGTSPLDPMMLEDVQQTAEWLADQTGLPIVMIGYSFGAYAMQSGLRPNTPAVVLICPTLRQHDFSRIAELSIPKLVIYSDNDFATSATVSESWIGKARPPVDTQCIEGAAHFFKGQEQQVCETCRAFLYRILSPAETS